MKRLVTITVLAAALAGGPAMAQLAQSSDAPIDIASDNFEGTNSACVTVWQGSAEALQDTARLRADVMKTYFKVKAPGGTATGQAACGDLERLEASGSVFYATPHQRARSDAAVYDVANRTITMTGDVILAQGQNVMRGQRIVINTQTGTANMQGASKGRNAAGRVRGVFYPNQPAPGQSR